MYHGFTEIANASKRRALRLALAADHNGGGSWAKTRRADGPRFMSRSKVQARSEPCREVADVRPGSLRFCRSKQSGSAGLHRICSIRDMIGAMPESFGKLAPCVLMSPLSIAQYLPTHQALFDVVVLAVRSDRIPTPNRGSLDRRCVRSANCSWCFIE